MLLTRARSRATHPTKKCSIPVARAEPPEKQYRSITESNQAPFDYSDGDPGCELDGIPAPCSYLQQTKNALGAQDLYHNSDLGFLHFQFSPNLDLPGAPIRFSIPSTITGRMVPDRGGSVGIRDEDSGQWIGGSDGVTGWRFQATGSTGVRQSAVDDWRSPFHFFSSDKRLSDKDCDFKMSRIFGGNAKAMESAGDINGTNRYENNGVLTPGHSATPSNDKPVLAWMDYNNNGRKEEGEMVKDLQRGGIIHTYTDATGSQRSDIPLTAPGGWIAGYSAFQGGNPITGLRYSNGITIEFIHVGTTNPNQIPTVPGPGQTGSLRTLGYIGGGGSAFGKTYHHTHIVFYSNKRTYTTIDPRKVFCGW